MAHDDYDIADAFSAIEEELIRSMIRNLDRHRAEEDKEGFLWSQWQVKQLQALEEYKMRNQRKYTKKFRMLNQRVEALIRIANTTGNMEQEVEILEAIKNGFRGYHRVSDTMQAEFFKLNERKLEALVKATTDDMQKAETAVLRMANDQYRKSIYKAQVYANTGAGTYEKAVDMATKDMLAAGLNCVQYANGARHSLSDYADMAIRTASKRAYLQGEGMKRQEWGISTVIMNKRGNPCPKCLPWVGKVLIDDVWSGGSTRDGPYPLMSYAISKGLYHPRCRDSHTTYFLGISTTDDNWTKEELEKVGLESKEAVKRQYTERQAEKYERMSKYSIDKSNKKKYSLRAAEWEKETDREKNKADILKAHSDFIDKLTSDEQPNLHKSKMALYLRHTDMVEADNLDAPFAYDPGADVIKYNPNAPHINDYDMDYVFTHEISHRMDVLEYHSWENEKFLQAIEISRQKVYDNIKVVEEWFEENGKYEDHYAISDIIGALSNGEIKVPVGHTKEYWSEDAAHVSMEIFADLSSIDVLELDEKEVILQDIFAAYREVIK